ncbi:BREX system P-loop protein BrxC [Thalassobacillus devorans]|uniref:BREX system P-loop protein BrxC n=1 Tax=Thalassobacillus devorans TaxID=279813 RepID=UPI00048F678C|nr:BREX system P-loop protein BrxC [Thalassobacillus devorans]
MEKILNLFDQNKDIYRNIEKVITYGTAQEDKLRAEISEYIVTESIEEQFQKLLTKMIIAMEEGNENEIGVWVSGFYGSGKSSLTKYLGLALDNTKKIRGIPFLNYLQDRFKKPETKELLSKASSEFPAKVVFLDLASEMLTGATMEDVSTVLYYKVLQECGYSRNLKVAALEQKLQIDGRYEEFENLILEKIGVDWVEVQNDPLVIDGLIPEIAHNMYPKLFKTTTSFSAETKDFITFEKDRVEEMINILRETTGKEYIIFVVDEVGQYVGSRQNLILNLDGLAKNLKNIGDGKVWILGTAQQTLTEDDPRTAINSPELFKLKDRFPIQIDLVSSDIKEISYRRLLSKSSEGEKLLQKLFDEYGQRLRQHTSLENAKNYYSDFNANTFINLYPFLPAHFDILLNLLGALAKSTGGIGLRSAIKVLQDILIEGEDGRSPVVKKNVGWLATTVTLYDSLEKDIKRAFPSQHGAVVKTLMHYQDSVIHKDIAKTVAILQMLENIPISIKNVTSLIQTSIDEGPKIEDVEAATKDLINNPTVPFGEQHGNLQFYSEKLNEIELERSRITLRSAETKRIYNQNLAESLSPLPTTNLEGVLTVKSGLKVRSGGYSNNLLGEREKIQTIIELVLPNEYEETRKNLIDESREKASQNIIYLLGRSVPEIKEMVEEIYRCQEINRNYRNEPDQEVKNYCAAQADRANELSKSLQHFFQRCFKLGSFIFRGESSPVEKFSVNIGESFNKYLKGIAKQVFYRFSEAPIRVDTSIAEKFLRVEKLSAITSEVDPLELVQLKNGKPTIKTEHKALISIRDYLQYNGVVEGKRVIDNFSDIPFGWSQDTIRYLIASLFLAGEIKLNVSGRDISVVGQQAIDALKTNNKFKDVNVSLREERPSNDILVRASQRLTNLIGDTVFPLEDEISKVAVKYLSRLQLDIATLHGKLSSMSLPGEGKIHEINMEIAMILSNDGSDATYKFGAEESILFTNINWALEVKHSLNKELEETIRRLNKHKSEIEGFPMFGVPEKLYEEVKDDLEKVNQYLNMESFYRFIPDLNSALTDLKVATRDAVVEMLNKQKNNIQKQKEELTKIKVWNELTQEEQLNILAQVEALIIEVSKDIEGLSKLVKQEFVINSNLEELKAKVEDLGKERVLKRLYEEKAMIIEEGNTNYNGSLKVPNVLRNANEIDRLINELEDLKSRIKVYDHIKVILKIED